MITIICSSIQICPVAHVDQSSRTSVTMKEGFEPIKVRQKKPVSFTIKSIPTKQGYRKDFTMQSILPLSEANSFYRYSSAMILLLKSSNGESYVIGSADFPVKAEFSGDNNFVTVYFKQSEPG